MANKKKGVSLAVGRGEKLPVSKGAGLTAKGRAKYNAATGSKFEQVSNSLGGIKDSLLSLDFDEAAQKEKEVLENLQRRDRKLRQSHSGSNH